MNSAKNAIAISCIFQTSGAPCWPTKQSYTLDQVMKKNVWIAIKIWFITKANFIDISSIRTHTGVWDYNNLKIEK
jgi:hypothetical protein